MKEIPGDGMSSVFGVTESILYPVQPEMNVVFKDFYGLKDLKVPVQLFQESLHVLSNGTVIATFQDNTPAVVESRYSSLPCNVC